MGHSAANAWLLLMDQQIRIPGVTDNIVMRLACLHHDQVDEIGEMLSELDRLSHTEVSAVLRGSYFYSLSNMGRHMRALVTELSFGC